MLYCNSVHYYRSWGGMKRLFGELLETMQDYSDQRPDMNSFQKLQAMAYAEIRVGIERQLSTRAYYRNEDITPETVRKMNHANVLTNCGCEGHFSDASNMIAGTAGGSSNLQTFSHRHVIAKNKLFETDVWKQMADKEQKAKFKWARHSNPAKQVRQMAKDWLQLTKDAERETISKRAEKKQKKNARSLKLLEKCKTHGGPLTGSDKDLGILETLNEQQLLDEVCYIRCTIDPNIRQKRKESGKFVKFTETELRSQLKMRLRPESDTNHCLDTLLTAALGMTEITIDTDIDNTIERQSEIPENQIGVTGWWHGPLGERKVGVILTKDSIQIYQKSNYGFVPEGYPIGPKGWDLNETIPEENVYYVMRRDQVFLKF